jgi:hypothetical protein
MDKDPIGKRVHESWKWGRQFPIAFFWRPGLSSYIVKITELSINNTLQSPVTSPLLTFSNTLNLHAFIPVDQASQLHWTTKQNYSVVDFTFNF